MEMRGGGRLFFCPEGLRVRLRAERPADGRGLYKAWLRGSRGGRLLLGTLAPEGDRLVLRRTLSLGELERAGCWPDFWAEAPLAFPFTPDSRGEGRWYCEQHPERLLADPVLKQQVRGSMLCQRQAGGFRLAVPFRTDAPIALAGLFCLAQVERWDNRPHLVWRFDQDGQPLHNHLPDRTD